MLQGFVTTFKYFLRVEVASFDGDEKTAIVGNDAVSLLLKEAATKFSENKLQAKDLENLKAFTFLFDETQRTQYEKMDQEVSKAAVAIAKETMRSLKKKAQSSNASSSTDNGTTSATQAALALFGRVKASPTAKNKT